MNGYSYTGIVMRLVVVKGHNDGIYKKRRKSAQLAARKLAIKSGEKSA